MNSRRGSEQSAPQPIYLEASSTHKPTSRGITTVSALGLAAGLIVAPAALTGAAALSPNSSDAPESDEQTFVFLTGEEKLARDVYTTLGEQYDANQFDRIAASEAQHLAAMRTVLDSLGYTDPTVGDAVGEFDDPELQQMYEDFVAQGSASLAAAAAVGVAIEQADIAQLTSALPIAPDEHTTSVLESQIAASQRHLAAFERLASGQTGPLGGVPGGMQNGVPGGVQNRAQSGGQTDCTESGSGNGGTGFRGGRT